MIQSFIEYLIIAILVTVSLKIIYKKYFTQQSSPCNECNACDKSDATNKNYRASDQLSCANKMDHSIATPIVFKAKDELISLKNIENR